MTIVETFVSKAAAVARRSKADNNRFSRSGSDRHSSDGHAGASSATMRSPCGSPSGSVICAPADLSRPASTTRRRSTERASDHALENARL